MLLSVTHKATLLSPNPWAIRCLLGLTAEKQHKLFWHWSGQVGYCTQCRQEKHRTPWGLFLICFFYVGHSSWPDPLVCKDLEILRLAKHRPWMTWWSNKLPFPFPKLPDPQAHLPRTETHRLTFREQRPTGSPSEKWRQIASLSSLLPLTCLWSRPFIYQLDTSGRWLLSCWQAGD